MSKQLNEMTLEEMNDYLHAQVREWIAEAEQRAEHAALADRWQLAKKRQHGGEQLMALLKELNPEAFVDPIQ